MKKFALAVVIAVALIATSALAVGNKYKQKAFEPADTSDVAADESVTSMSDCMTFSAGHKTKGLEGDKAEFGKQFGEPVNKAGTLMTYNYDKYTKVMLDCSKKSCSCRCSPKN